MVRLPRDHGHDSLQRFCRHRQFTIESYRKAFVIFRLSVFYSKLDQHRKPRSLSSPWFAAISLTCRGIPVMNECSISFEPLAQAVEHLPFKQRVAGSNPARLIFRPRRLAWPRTPAFHAGDTGSNPVGDATSPLNTQHARKIYLLRRNRKVCGNIHFPTNRPVGWVKVCSDEPTSLLPACATGMVSPIR